MTVNDPEERDEDDLRPAPTNFNDVLNRLIETSFLAWVIYPIFRS